MGSAAGQRVVRDGRQASNTRRHDRVGQSFPQPSRGTPTGTGAEGCPAAGTQRPTGSALWGHAEARAFIADVHVGQRDAPLEMCRGGKRAHGPCLELPP